MRTFVALLFGLAFVASPFTGVAGEKQITDVKELAGNWRGWVYAKDLGQEHANGDSPGRVLGGQGVGCA